LKEVGAVHNSDKEQGLKDFDRALFAHAGFVISNLVRTLWMALSSAHFLITPGHGITKYYYRQLVRMSSSFALMTDACVAVLGGSLKRREKISGRFADALSNMYVLTAALKHFEDDGSPEEDIPLLKWACDDALYNIQQAMKGIMMNINIPLLGGLLNMLVFPLSKPYQKPDDKLGHQVARLLLQPSATLDRLTRGIYVNKNPDDASGRILLAQELVLKTADIERKLRTAKKTGELKSDDAGMYEEAKRKNIIDDKEFELLVQTRLAVQNAIKVDEFSNTGWKVETP
jgi:acyl-CoA dehydrogenase